MPKIKVCCEKITPMKSEIKETPEKCVENILKVYQEKRLK